MTRHAEILRETVLRHRRYTVRCSSCPGLVIHVNGSARAARVVEAHQRDCDGEVVAHPHPDRDRRYR